MECEYEHLVTEKRMDMRQTSDLLTLLTDSEVKIKYENAAAKILQAVTYSEGASTKWRFFDGGPLFPCTDASTSL